MQNGSHVSLGAETQHTTCAFCDRSEITHILKETSHFLLAADHAPLVEGHLLIIPKQHFTCYGDTPPELDTELASVKQEVHRFFSHYYAPPVFWEHGIFRQTVFHAHLHCFPFGGTAYEHAKALHSLVVHSLDDLRAWHAEHGQYFYMEDDRSALLFAPEMDRYMQVVRDVLWHGMSTQTGRHGWRSSQQRQLEGTPLILALVDKWKAYQQQGAHYADESSTR